MEKQEIEKQKIQCEKFFNNFFILKSSIIIMEMIEKFYLIFLLFFFKNKKFKNCEGKQKNFLFFEMIE